MHFLKKDNIEVIKSDTVKLIKGLSLEDLQKVKEFIQSL